MQIISAGIVYRVFDHLYAVSACGKVFHLKYLAPKTPSLRKDGYVAVGRGRLLHRMVATCWIRDPDEGELVHHKNHDKTDNRADNLEWLTPKKHIGEKHRDTVGRHVRTEAMRQKQREYRQGKKTSEATKQKQREASLRLGLKPPKRPVGYKCSAESVELMRLNSPNKVACEIQGQSYRSFSEAGRALGMKPHTLRKRCLSTNSFHDHKC